MTKLPRVRHVVDLDRAFVLLGTLAFGVTNAWNSSLIKIHLIIYACGVG